MTVTRQVKSKSPQERIFLTNCIGKDLESEAAYYSGSPVANPDSVAVIATPNGELKHWENTTTTVTFTDTGTEFSVTLGPRPDDGLLAGTAYNSWGTNFTCYAQASIFLYARDNRNCSSVYDCNHADNVSVSSVVTATASIDSSLWIPASSASISSATLSIGPNASTTSGLPFSPTTTTNIPTGQASPHHGSSALPVSAVIGVSIGITLGSILLAVSIISLLRKYWNWKRPVGASGVKFEQTGSNKTKGAERINREMYEADGKAIPTELAACAIHVHELEGKPRRI
ncbi:hypothetical protein F5Y19DRAFT_371804 [Xylariaceae sp. FL1651]|nr:hypothetical protein F5Y19DRAFT_371804 [Xylariaceae sp. FL1651]